jgi:hypothetical protein
MSTPVRVKHLRYEVQMLGEMRRKLHAREFNDQWTANALIEAFCVHASLRPQAQNQRIAASAVATTPTAPTIVSTI